MRVLIVDDHPLFLFALRRIVDAHPRLELAAQVRSGREAVAAAREERPDVAIVDVDMPVFTGIDVLHAFARERLPTRSLCLTEALDPDTVYAAVEAGAHGLLAKAAAPEEIGATALRVGAGETALAAEAQVALAQGVRARRERQAAVDAHREGEILRGLAAGHSPRRIAGDLGVDARAVKDDLQRLYARFGVCDRAAAVAEAIRRGLIE